MEDVINSGKFVFATSHAGSCHHSPEPNRHNTTLYALFRSYSSRFILFSIQSKYADICPLHCILHFQPIYQSLRSPLASRPSPGSGVPGRPKSPNSPRLILLKLSLLCDESLLELAGYLLESLATLSLNGEVASDRPGGNASRSIVSGSAVC